MSTEISLESLKKAIEAICPESCEELYNMDLDMSLDSRFDQFDRAECMRNAMFATLMNKIADTWKISTDDLCALIRNHRNEHCVRSYFLLYRMYFDGCIPKIEFARCFSGVLFQSDLRSVYSYTRLELDSRKDEIEIPKEYRVFSAEGCGSDWTHFAENFFKNEVWPQIKSGNQDNPVCSTNDPEEYDEDYL